MTSLADFLLARIAEDEADARDATFVVAPDLSDRHESDWWSKPEHSRVYAGHWNVVVQGGAIAATPTMTNTAALDHIARHDPARVLAECEAKRRIVALHAHDLIVGWWWDECPALSFEDRRNPVCPTLRLLAAVYAAHPDYRQEWTSAPPEREFGDGVSEYRSGGFRLISPDLTEG